MIPSIYSTVEAYRKEGRINAEAAYKVLGVTSGQAERTSAEKRVLYAVDTMALVDEDLSDFFKGGCSIDTFNATLSFAVERVLEWHELPFGELSTGPIYRYVRECARMNLDNPRRGRNMVSSIIMRNAGESIPANDLCFIMWNRYLHDLFNPTDESIKKAVDKVEKHYRADAPYFLGRGASYDDYHFHMNTTYPLIEKLQGVPGFVFKSATVHLLGVPGETSVVSIKSTQEFREYPYLTVRALHIDGEYGGEHWSCMYSPDVQTLSTSRHPRLITSCTPVEHPCRAQE